MKPLLGLMNTIFFLVLAMHVWASAALATSWVVDPSGTGNFRTIQEGINAAQPGDVVIVSDGTYNESLTTIRAGTADARITIKGANEGTVVVTEAGRVLDIQDPFITVESLVFDGQFGTKVAVRVGSSSDSLILRNIEVRNASRDCVDMGASKNTLIENSRIHHCLRMESGQRMDAHGITGGGVLNLTIRNVEIFYVSGDAIQFSPDRSFWDNILVEKSHIWNGPLPQSAAGFAAGEVTGESGIDTKTPTSGPRSHLVVRETLIHGFKGVISNQAALNMKENIDATIDRVTAYDSDIGYRLRGPANVTVTNCVLYNIMRGVRYEDEIDVIRLYNCTFGNNIPQLFQDVGGNPDVRNTLFFAGSKPSEASEASNRLATSTDFVNPITDDYHLAQGSGAIDTGEILNEVLTDHDGISRPQGAGFDVGAYEFIASTFDTTPPAPPINLMIN